MKRNCVSTALVPNMEQNKNIDMMMNSTTRKLDVFNLEINIKFESLHSGEKYTSLNPIYKKIIKEHQHLQGIRMTAAQNLIYT